MTLLLFVFATMTGCSNPKDESLKSIFSAKRSVFMQLITLLKQDSDVEYITPDKVGARAVRQDGQGHPMQNMIGDDRVAQYQKLLRDVGATRVEVWPSGPIMFYYSKVLASAKGIAMWPNGLVGPPAVKSASNLDDWKDLLHRSENVYLEPIEGTWFIFVTTWD